MPAILDWRQVATPDDLVRQVAQALAEGSTVALPTEAGYFLAVDPTKLADPLRPAGLPADLSLSRTDAWFDARDFFAQVPNASPLERALAARIWPGPIGWVHSDSPHPVWVPAHHAVGLILAGRRTPLALFEINGGQPIDPTTFGAAVALVLTDGEPRRGPISLMRMADARWTMVREGVRSTSDVALALARQIAFVCTGNTCRSPMAAALFKTRVAERLNCAVSELPSRGIVVESAGLAAMDGAPATPDSAEAVRAFGGDLSGHRSRPASYDLIARADDVIAMTRSHLLTLVGRYPVLAGSLRLLGGTDGDLEDPIGGGPDVYRACAAVVQTYVDRLILEMGLS